MCESKNVKTGILYILYHKLCCPHEVTRATKLTMNKQRKRPIEKSLAVKALTPTSLTTSQDRKPGSFTSGPCLASCGERKLLPGFCHDSLPSYMIEDELDEGFKGFIEFACQEYELPTADTIGNYIKKLFELRRRKSMLKPN